MSMSKHIDISEYIKKRDKALITLDKEKLEELFTDTDTEIPEDEEVFWAGVHKARIQVTSMPETLKDESRMWLLANGYCEMI